MVGDVLHAAPVKPAEVHLPVRLAALARLLSPVLHLFGQQGEQVDGNGAPILPIAQVVHQSSREGKVTDASY